MDKAFKDGFMPLPNGVIGVDPGFGHKLHYMVSAYPELGPDDGVMYSCLLMLGSRIKVSVFTSRAGLVVQKLLFSFV